MDMFFFVTPIYITSIMRVLILFENSINRTHDRSTSELMACVVGYRVTTLN